MWQPIETAPKDKEVLLYCPKRGVVRGWWKDCRYSTKPRPYWTHDRERMCGVIETRDDQPTHWMPLPDAPDAQVQPALSVPDEDAAYNDWFHGEQGVAYDGMWSFAKAAWMARAALAAPETKPAPSVSVGWLHAIDEALVVTHLGVANADDSYEDAKQKLNELIGWHVAVATDPAVNGGFKLVPIEPDEMWAYRVIRHHQPNLEVGCGDWMKCLETMLHWHAAMLAAAPEAKS